MSWLPNGVDQGVSVRATASPQSPMALSQSVNTSPPRVNPHLSCTSTPDYLVRVPTPILTDLDPVEDDVPPSPPRPNGYPNTSIPSHLPILEAVVVLSDCTAVNSNATSPTPPRLTNHSPPPNSSPPQSSRPNPNQHRSPKPSVALNGCTDGDGEFVQNQSFNHLGASPPTTSASPETASQNPFIIPPPLSEMSFQFSSNTSSSNGNTPSHDINPHPLVTLNGCTNSNGNEPSTNANHPNPESDVESSSEFVREWSSKISTATSFDEFCSKCDEYANAFVTESKAKSGSNPPRRGMPVRNPRNRPNNQVPNRNRQPLLFNPRETRRIQILYRLSKKRAARQIFQDNSTIYTGTKDQAQDYFSNTFSSSALDLDDLVSSLSDNVPSAETDNSIMDPMSTKEIKNKLRSMSNSAPGKDRVEYRHLKMVDPECKVLGLIFNKCLEENKVPLSWKQSTTILIYKKGSSDDPSNFRPIALMSCIYKLFTSILSSRVSHFAIDSDLISAEQKSAKPSEGCHEHSFTLQSVVADCKRNQKNCFLAWLDLRNAFGSISHTIYTTLQHMGFPNSLIRLIKDIYTDATTIVKTKRDEEKDPVQVNAGVKQGCPISPILFNLTTELIIRAVKSRCEENSDISFKMMFQRLLTPLIYRSVLTNVLPCPLHVVSVNPLE
jgi:hypothetical protein